MTSPTIDLDAAVREAADRLLAAAAEHRPCAPVRDLIGASDINLAYAVQQRVNETRIAAGARVVGRKIGLTSKAVQAQLGVDQPDLGVLFDDMEYDASAPVHDPRLIQPKAEAEIAFVLGADLAEGELDLDQVRAAIEYAVVALEICDSRIADWDIRFGDTVADNASAGGYVLGTERRTLAEFSPVEAEMRMSVTGQEDSVGNGAACLGDPLLAVQWLARAARDLGEPLQAGQVILSGALGPMRPIGPGAEVHVAITGLGELSIRMSEES
ncbi:fumarylacetoacetate hydrolase family protein [Nocardioides sp. zg-ZUI104]|uniref:2-keto-4-pentenoate hydratase n=1 Tax=Nocardioides faecalis TaxID=2803858 RepID=UPI001BCA8EEF|nr:fumarylacetoacetate hydrolase family protein [Nocardioides faecalis]MBS4752129.1 fumarylacetoacetate hydrolase family protein [Nocardioides faecalis]